MFYWLSRTGSHEKWSEPRSRNVPLSSCCFQLFKGMCDGFFYQLKKYNFSSKFVVHPKTLPAVGHVQNISPGRHQDFLTRISSMEYCICVLFSLLKKKKFLSKSVMILRSVVLWSETTILSSSLCRFLAVCFFIAYFFFFFWISFSCDLLILSPGL